MPPPAIQTVNAYGWWSRPQRLRSSMLPWRNGVRPNSPPQMTSVSSSKPALLQVLDQRRRGLVGVAALDVELGGQVAVLVPAGVHDLHEPHAALDQPAGHQAVVGERALLAGPRGRTSSSTSAGSLREVGQLGHAGLHLDTPSRTGRCAWRSRGRRSRCSFISFSRAMSSSRPRRICAAHAVGVRQVEHRVAAAAELHALEPRRQEARAPVEVVEDLPAGRPLAHRGHDDERRQLVGLAAEAVGQPGARASAGRGAARR